MQSGKETFYTWIVEKAFSGKSLLFFLEKKLPEIPSKRVLKKAIEKNLAFVNEKVERFASKKLKAGDTVKIACNWKETIPSSKSSSFTDIPIVYEDKDLLVIDKPSGLESKESFFNENGFFLCHRLDKETSGLLILAKTASIRDLMVQEFKDRNVEKIYLALVDRMVSKEEGEIENFLSKKSSFEGQTVYGSGYSGKIAITHFKCIEKNQKLSFLLLVPKTGRTHQLRVHLSEMGHPILGDFHYCKKFFFPFHVSRVLLHSYRLEFTHPITKKKLVLKANIPQDFRKVSEMGGLCLQGY